MGVTTADGVSAPRACGTWAWGRLDAEDLRDPTRDTFVPPTAPVGGCGGWTVEEFWLTEAAP